MSSAAPVWQVFTSCWFVLCSLQQTANLVRFYAINRGKVCMFDFTDALLSDEAIKLLRIKLASRAPIHFRLTEACLVQWN